MKKILLVFLLVFWGCSSDRRHIAINDENGFGTTWDAKSKSLKFSDWDKPFALFFFTTYCGACKEQVVVLNELLSEHKGEFKVIGVLGDGGKFDEDMKILKEKGIEFATTSDKRSVDYFSKLVGGVMGTPLTIIFDANGKRVANFLGLYPKSAFEKELKLSL